MKITDQRTFARREAHPENKAYEWDIFSEESRTIAVHDRESATVDTGLIDKDGNAIHRRVMRPIGFVVFD